MKDFKKYYSESDLFKKIKKYGKKAGVSIVYAILILYYTLMKSEIPMKDKLIVIGAIGYFIAPIDAIPDFIPLGGYTDDFGALMFAMVKVARHIDDEVKGKAKDKLKTWFKEVNEEQIIAIEKEIHL